MKELKILQPALPQGVTISSTTWNINESETMDGVVRLNVIEDVVNKLKINLPFEIQPDEILYAQIILHLSDGTTVDSNVLMLKRNTNTNPSLLYVYSPIVTYDKLRVADENLRIKISPPKFYKNAGTHISTSWRLKTTDGVVFYRRDNDTDNLLSINIDNVEYKGKSVFVIEAVYHFDTSNIEIFGRANVSNNGDEPMLSLSRKYLISGENNKVFISHYDLNIKGLSSTIIINGEREDPILMTPIDKGIIIHRDSISDASEVIIELKIVTENKTTIDTFILPIIHNADIPVFKLNKEAEVKIIPTDVVYDGLNIDASPVSNDKFLLTKMMGGSLESTLYKLSNDDSVSFIRKPATIPYKIYDSPDNKLFYKDDNNIYPLSNDFDDIPNKEIPILVSTRSAISFKSNELHYISDNNKINIVDVDTKTNTFVSDIIAPITLDSIRYINSNYDVLEVVPISQSTGMGRIILPNHNVVSIGILNPLEHLRVFNHIVVNDGIITIATGNTRIIIKHISYNGITTIMKTIQLADINNIPCTVYDNENNIIYIIGKGTI